MTLDEHMEMAATLARKIFEDRKELYPIVHAIDKDGNHHVIGVPQIGGTDEEKDLVAVALRDDFKKRGIEQYILIIEAWTLRLPPDTDLKELPRPRDHADRIEVVTLQAEAKDGDNICGEMVITRDTKGKPSLGELQSWRAGVLHGRLTGLLMAPKQ